MSLRTSALTLEPNANADNEDGKVEQNVEQLEPIAVMGWQLNSPRMGLSVYGSVRAVAEEQVW